MQMGDQLRDAEAASRIEQALRLQTVEARDYLIVWGNRRRNYFVQFPSPEQSAAGSGLPPSLYCEAVSDLYLSPENALGARGAERLLDLGWVEPTATPASTQLYAGPRNYRSPNWSREFDLPNEAAFARIAQALLVTLSSVYGYSGGPLELEIG